MGGWQRTRVVVVMGGGVQEVWQQGVCVGNGCGGSEGQALWGWAASLKLKWPQQRGEEGGKEGGWQEQEDEIRPIGGRKFDIHTHACTHT